MDNAEEALKRQIEWFREQIKETRQPAADALDGLEQTAAAFEELEGLARHSLTSPLGCLVCAITFFMLSWACAREFGLFEYVNVRLISVQIVRGGSNSAAFWYLMWPFSILLSWALVPVFRSCGPFDAKRRVWTGLIGAFVALQAFGLLSCFYAAFDRIQDPSREVLESFGQGFGTMLFLTLLQILMFWISDKRAAEVKAAEDQLEAARFIYREKSTSFVSCYQRYVMLSRELETIKAEKKRQEEAKKRAAAAEKKRQEEAARKERERREAEERRRAEEQARKKRQEEERQRQAHRKSREQFFTERLGEKANTASALRAHWQTDANIHERNTAYGMLFRLFAWFNLSKHDLDEYLSHSYKQAA